MLQNQNINIAIRHLINCLIAVPSQAPWNLTVTAISSTSIAVAWQLPPVDSRNGIIRGFRLYLKKKGFVGLSANITITNGTIHNTEVNGLDKYTEYELQMLAFTSVGDGPRSSTHAERTKEDGNN